MKGSIHVSLRRSDSATVGGPEVTSFTESGRAAATLSEARPPSKLPAPLPEPELGMSARPVAAGGGRAGARPAGAKLPACSPGLGPSAGSTVRRPRRPEPCQGHCPGPARQRCTAAQASCLSGPGGQARVRARASLTESGSLCDHGYPDRPESCRPGAALGRARWRPRPTRTRLGEPGDSDSTRRTGRLGCPVTVGGPGPEELELKGARAG